MTAGNNQKLFIDPVCGMRVDPATAAARMCYSGIQYYFCAEACRRAFETSPQNYTRKRKSGFGSIQSGLNPSA
jgi:YHS domain-containing protein